MIRKKRLNLIIHFFYVNAIISGRNTRDTIDINLINMFNDGPEVSLHGSPTVSPITVDL